MLIGWPGEFDVEPILISARAALLAWPCWMQGAATQSMQRSPSTRSRNAADGWVPPQPEGTGRYKSDCGVAPRERCFPLHRFLVAPCPPRISARRGSRGYQDRLLGKEAPLWLQIASRQAPGCANYLVE